MSVRHPTRTTFFALLVCLPTVGGIAYLLVDARDQLSLSFIPWLLLVAAVELLPVPTWRGVQVSLGFPLLIAVAIIYPPAVAALVALLGSFDPRELRREITVLRAVFNRCQVALAVLAASSIFHAFANVNEPLVEIVPVALLATLVDYLINLGLVTVGGTLAYGVAPVAIVRQLLGRGQEFLISYVGLGIVGTVLAKLTQLPKLGFLSVVTVLAPLLFARQMFFRSQALEEAHKELQDREQVLRALSNRMAEERQDERAAIAAYLHDDLAQLLFRLSIQVDVARRHLSSGRTDQAAESLEKIKDTKQETSDRVRALIRDLHRSPLGHAGLAEALHGFIAETARDSGVRFHTDIDEVALPPPIALLVYHIAREGTMNALKHANASDMWVTVKQDEQDITLILRDDGDGFDSEAPGPEGHFGLAMMSERARVGGGTFELQSARGAGTTITVRFPTSLLQQDEEQGGPQAGASDTSDASPGTPGGEASDEQQKPSPESVPA
jgi:signal transduction histidine kinase